MARPAREVVVLVGDGGGMMLTSELATPVTLGRKLVVVLLDNCGRGRIDRLQTERGGEGFDNLLDASAYVVPSAVDFAAHDAAMGALSEKVATVAEPEDALARARAADRTSVVVIDTDPPATTRAGGRWWDVAVPEVSDRPQVAEARRRHERQREHQHTD